VGGESECGCLSRWDDTVFEERRIAGWGNEERGRKRKGELRISDN
jgi:hypothetical protein